MENSYRQFKKWNRKKKKKKESEQCRWHMQNLYSADMFSPVEKPQEDEEEAEGHRWLTGLNVEHFQEVSHGLHRVKGRPSSPLVASYDKLKDPVGGKKKGKQRKELLNALESC